MSGKIHSDHHISGPDNRSIMETYTKKVAKVEIEKDEKSTNKYAEIIRESLKKRAINTGIGAVVGAGTGAYKHASDWAHRTARKNEMSSLKKSIGKRKAKGKSTKAYKSRLAALKGDAMQDSYRERKGGKKNLLKKMAVGAGLGAAAGALQSTKEK